jgi:hypothetical protein
MSNERRRPSDELLLSQCRKEIETRLGWGDSATWAHQDFAELSERIRAETRVNLSPTTLKRVWGRVKYDSLPNATTLNTLAAFVGYESWREFRRGQQEPLTILTAEPVPPPVGEPSVPVRRVRLGRWVLLIGLLVGAAGLGVVFLTPAARGPLSPEDFTFSSRSVTKGIPNSVVFRYDATAAPTDSVFIQQSWDPSRRHRVPKNQHTFTSQYFYPGFFRAKLLVGRQVVREHNLLIPSDGWVVAIDQESVPVYFPENEVIRDGVLGLPVAAIENSHVSLQPRPPFVRYRNVPPLGGLRNDNFVLETRIRHDFRQGSAVCQRAQITLLCQNDVLTIPLSAPGCTANLNLYLAGHEARSPHADLSALGTDLSQWTTLRCEVRNKQIRLWLNGRPVYQTVFPNPPALLVGISYDFEGTGSVDYARLTRPNGEVVFEDDFNQPR